jgi:hypothetical protein
MRVTHIPPPPPPGALMVLRPFSLPSAVKEYLLELKYSGQYLR